MRHESYALDVPSVVADGAVCGGARELTAKWLYVTGWTAGTFRLWGNSGAGWVQLGADIVGNALRSVPETVEAVRVGCAVPGAAPSVVVVGLNARSDP